MAPEALELRFADLQDRLNTLQEATLQLKEQIDRLADFDFQPGSVPLGSNEDDTVSAELSAEINQFLREQEEELELLDEEIEDVRPGHGEPQHDKARLKDGAQRLKGELQSCRVSFRKAQITAKHNLRLAQKQERALLFASFAAPNNRSGASSPAPFTTSRRKQNNNNPAARSELSREEQAVAAGNDVTLAMRRAHDLMAAELSQSEFAHRTLRESSAQLAQLGESYSSLNTMLAGSRELLGTLMRSQKSDTWYLESSFYALAATIAWLIFRRFLYGPAWWLVWLPLKFAFRGGIFVSKGVGLYGGSQDVAIESMGSSQPGSQVVMNNEGVPTINVGQEKTREANFEEDPDSMVEEIGRVIDDSKAPIVLDSDHEPGAQDEMFGEGTDAINIGEVLDAFEPEVDAIEPGPERVRVEL